MGISWSSGLSLYQPLTINLSPEAVVVALSFWKRGILSLADCSSNWYHSSNEPVALATSKSLHLISIICFSFSASVEVIIFQ
ncbi:MAG TPA: hypothetical protein PLZ08_02655 [Bacillota bacterium]|nr:hypothetical protein [Bacillota bacterium]HOL09164.1 hypothetical protein [Bacillota bacterium]HPO96839.1 hypothetical protein [Bacillota bacterium]